MFKGVQWFMERLVERLVPLIATSFSSTVETMHALGQAEQQNQLEEAARRYEEEGKADIARALRRRAAQLTSTNPAAEAAEIFSNVAGSDQPLLPSTQPMENGLARLPDLAKKAARPRGRKSPAQPKEATPLDFPNPNQDTEGGQL